MAVIIVMVWLLFVVKTPANMSSEFLKVLSKDFIYRFIAHIILKIVPFFNTFNQAL